MDVESREKFEGMYLKYQGVLRRLAYEYEIPPDYIDDVVQDTFVSFAQYDYSLEQSSRERKYCWDGSSKAVVWIFTEDWGISPVRM